jgi:hypothetical protein
MEKLSETVLGLFKGLAGYDVVIQVGEKEGQVLEEAVIEELKVCAALGIDQRCIQDGMRHEEVFKLAKRSYDGCFADVLRHHGDLMVAFDQIYVGKKLAAVQFVGYAKDAGNGV